MAPAPENPRTPAQPSQPGTTGNQPSRDPNSGQLTNEPTKSDQPNPALKDTPQPTPQPSVMPNTAPAKATMQDAQAAMDAVLGSPIHQTTHSMPSQTTPTVEYTPTATIVDTGKNYRLRATLPARNLLVETDVEYGDPQLVAKATAIAQQVKPGANITEARRARNAMTNEQLLAQKTEPGIVTPRKANPKAAPVVEKRMSEPGRNTDTTPPATDRERRTGVRTESGPKTGTDK